MSYRNYINPGQPKFVIKEVVKFPREEFDMEIDLLKMAQHRNAIRRAFSEPFGHRRYEVKTIK